MRLCVCPHAEECPLRHRPTRKERPAFEGGGNRFGIDGGADSDPEGWAPSTARCARARFVTGPTRPSQEGLDRDRSNGSNGPAADVTCVLPSRDRADVSGGAGPGGVEGRGRRRGSILHSSLLHASFSYYFHIIISSSSSSSPSLPIYIHRCRYIDVHNDTVYLSCARERVRVRLRSLR